jgi:hypothetical protein
MHARPKPDPLVTEALGRTPAGPRPPALLSGLDLGTRADYSALAVAERSEVSDGRGRFVGHYRLRALKRWPLKTSYADIVAEVVAAFARPPLAGSVLCIDGTGVGVAVVDLFRKARPSCRLVPITITGGAVARAAPLDGGWSVPKRDLASVLQALLGTRRLQISPALELAGELAKELSTFTVKVNIATGNESFEAWRERDKDDMVLAAAMPLWFGERANRRLTVFV